MNKAQHDHFVIPLLFVVSAILMVAVMPREGQFKYQYQKGSPWMYENLDASFDFPILKTEEELRLEREKAAKYFTPYFSIKSDIEAEQLRAFSAAALDAGLPDMVSGELLSFYKELYGWGIMDETRYNQLDPEIGIAVLSGKTAEKRPVSEIYTIPSAYNYLLQKLTTFNKNEINTFNHSRLELMRFLVPNLIYDEATTPSIIFIQSQVPEVMELHTYLSMVTPLGKLTDLPTFKEKVRQHPNNVNYGLVGYPVLMTADIVLYKANLVPVGVDQAPHIEFSRETVRSFNYRYNTNVLIEPDMKATEFPKVIGIDGQAKMSKSLNNHIELASSPEETQQRVMQMVTDPQRVRRSDPGNPDVCNVFAMHKVFSSVEEVAAINVDCRKAAIGCVQCKQLLARNINAHLAPFRERRALLDQKPHEVRDILVDGKERARAIARQTMREVRDAIGLPEID